MKRLPVLFTLLLLLGGCMLTSEQPLGTIEDAYNDEKLKGAWVFTDEDSQENFSLLILAGKHTDLVMIPFDFTYQFEDGYVGHVTSIKGHTFLNLRPYSLEKGVLETEQDDGYIIVYYKIEQNTVWTHLLNNEFFYKVVKEGKLKGTVDDEYKAVQSDDSPENIRKFIKNNKIGHPWPIFFLKVAAPPVRQL